MTHHIHFSHRDTNIARFPDHVVISYGGNDIQIEPLTPGAIHVEVTRAGGKPSASLVRVSQAKPTPFSVREDSKTFRILTSKVCTVFNRETGAISYCDLKGKPFLTEKPGTRLVQPTTLKGKPCFSVGQSFDAPPTEKLFGLGQFQNGLWDWRGLPLELRQLNTQITVPVLFSNRNYGLLWENASRTDFDPADIQIPLSLAPRKPREVGNATGSFTAPTSGEYAFAVRDGDRRQQLSIFVDGKPLNDLSNTWTPSALEGRVTLSANQTVSLQVKGGGQNIKLLARKLDDTTTFRSDYGQGINYTVFHGSRPQDIVAEYRAVTGKAPLFPKWAYGFWQCRERYSSQTQIVQAAAEFRARHIPMDLMVQDWLYWGPYGWGSYAWDEKAYPDPKGMIDSLHSLQAKYMISVWCNPTNIREELKSNNALAGIWVDVFSDKGRSIRWNHINDTFFSKGTDAWWGDATEPGDPGTELLGVDTAAGPGDEVTSSYPLMASRGLYEGQRSTGTTKRVTNLTRSAFAGSQRYGAASWSGDINSTWDAFRRQIPASLNFSLTGVPYWTTDTGGFFRPRDQYASPDFNELLVRWFQWSTFCPILRIHGYQSRTEMWNYLPSTQKILLAYDQLRYRMLPYNYGLAAQVWKSDETILRPLGFSFPNDKHAWDISDTYLYGPSILVAPVTSPGATTRDVYLPKNPGGWIDFWTGKSVSGGRSVNAQAPIDRVPLFVRAGSIIPLGPVVENVEQAVNSPLEIRVYPGANGSFTVYDDEGDGYGYEKGACSQIPLKWDDASKTLTIGRRIGSYPGMAKERTLRVVLVKEGTGVGLNEDKNGKFFTYRGGALKVTL